MPAPSAAWTPVTVTVMPHVKPSSAVGLLLVLGPAMAEAHGIGLGEVSFGIEVLAILVGLVVFSVGEPVARSVWLNSAFLCLVAVAWLISFGVADSLSAGAFSADESVPTTLGVGLLIGAGITWRLKRSRWRKSGEEHTA